MKGLKVWGQKLRVKGLGLKGHCIQKGESSGKNGE